MSDTASVYSLFIRSFFAACWWQAALFMVMGKFARYAVIAMVTV
jgi:hypothetical protein